MAAGPASQPGTQRSSASEGGLPEDRFPKIRGTDSKGQQRALPLLPLVPASHSNHTFTARVLAQQNSSFSFWVFERRARSVDHRQTPSILSISSLSSVAGLQAAAHRGFFVSFFLLPPQSLQTWSLGRGAGPSASASLGSLPFFSRSASSSRFARTMSPSMGPLSVL